MFLKLDASRNRFVVIERGVKGLTLARNADGIMWTRSAGNAAVQARRPDESGVSDDRRRSRLPDRSRWVHLGL